jgi:beta-galactosidase
VWRVAYEPGTLRAIARNNGAQAAVSELRTAGKPAKVTISLDRVRLGHGFDDVAYVTATVVDANGVQAPTADQQIAFQVTGPGAIVAVDNADNAGHEPFQASERRAYQGVCIAIVRAKGAGRISITASAAGLMGSTLAIQGE